VLKGILAFGLTRRAIVLLGLLVFIAGGLIAFTRLNIEAYPNPAPVILEITAQAAGLSAEEMERYYTVPMEVGLYVTPGVDNIRSTSFYGLSFVRVTFKYGVDYFFAYTQTALSLAQNVSLPGAQVPQIQQSSLVGEVYRYQVVGPPNFGLTNLRTVQDWIVARRLYTVPGVVAVNSWGGTTKQYNVDVDLNKLDAYNVTIPQVITALGNANINVGGREITVGQQSVNIRGIGLMDSGGDKDLTQGWHVSDIENVVPVSYTHLDVYKRQGPARAKADAPNAPNHDADGVDLSDSQLSAVKVAPVEERDFPVEKQAVGSIDFNENMSVQVFAPYQGRIIALSAEVGDDVKKGQTLFTIDSPDLLQAESTLIAAAGVLELTTRNLARLQELYTTRAVSQHDVEQATSDQQTAEGNLRAARDAVRIFGKTCLLYTSRCV